MFRISGLLFLLFATFTANAASSEPNVIIVMTDDQGYGEFSCHGNPVVRTPHIDQLAKQSVRLTDFHVAPMCTPTRGQLLTGLDAFRNSAINVSSGRTLLNAKLKTMADVFRDAGYRTGIFGKWHLGDNYPFRPQDRGFDESLWFPSSHINSVPDHWDNDYFADTYLRGDQPEQVDGYCTDVFFDSAMQWIQQSNEQPFFAFIPLNAAHYPWFVPDSYRDSIREAVKKHSDLFAALADNPKRLEDLISFLAMGANIDDNMGRLTTFLDQRGLSDDTIVIFMTDNGSTFGREYYNAGMRGKKTQLWEGGHRVPCFIRWPKASFPMDQDVDVLCHVQDLLPTLADAAGIQEHLPKTPLDGESLVKVFQGDPTGIAERMLVINYSRMPGMPADYTDGSPTIPHRDGAAVLWKSWRLIENRMLYNVATDPHQDTDVAKQYPDVVHQMRQHLLHWWDRVRDDVMTPQRVIIGSDNENPTRLTACEWLDVFVDQQLQVRLGQRKNGVWHLEVANPGRYRIQLRRWPRESGLQLDAGTPPKKVTDGEYLPGRALPIVSAKLNIGQQTVDCEPSADRTHCSATVSLTAGPIEMQTWFLDQNGNEIVGAYYAEVERLGNSSP